jgi:hypothetical protein
MKEFISPLLHVTLLRVQDKFIYYVGVNGGLSSTNYKTSGEITHRSFLMVRQPLGGIGRLIFRGFTITLSDTPHSVGLLWTSDQSVAETST